MCAILYRGRRTGRAKLYMQSFEHIISENKKKISLMLCYVMFNKYRTFSVLIYNLYSYINTTEMFTLVECLCYVMLCYVKLYNYVMLREVRLLYMSAYSIYTNIIARARIYGL